MHTFFLLHGADIFFRSVSVKFGINIVAVTVRTESFVNTLSGREARPSVLFSYNAYFLWGGLR